MKQLFLLFLLSVTLLNCKKDSNEPLPAIKPIAGIWRLEAYEKTVNGQQVWEKVTDTEPSYLIFRFDGVILDKNGLSGCCPPGSYTINGILFKVEPKAALPRNPQCSSFDYYCCPLLIIETDGDELIISSCVQNARTKYIRE